MEEKESMKYVSLRTGSGAIVLTEFYMVEYGDEDHFFAVKPIDVISLGFSQDETGEISENLIYRRYIRFSQDIECAITSVETVAKLDEKAEAYYLEKRDELYPTILEEPKEEISEEAKAQTNIILGKFTKKFH